MKNISIIKATVLRPIIILLQKTALLSALSCRLVKWTGKHPDPIHPKHLIQIRKPWYLSYIRKTDNVLDIGCNNGQHTLKIAPHCHKIYGFDYDPVVIELAKREAIRKKITNISLAFGNAQEKYPFKNATFNTVIFLDVFEHLPRRKQTLSEIKRVLKKKGLLLISIPNSDTSWKKLQKSLSLPYYSDPDHKIEFSKNSITKVLVSAGFVVRELFPVTLDTPWVGFIDVLGGLSLRLYTYAAVWRRRMALVNPQESIGFEIVAQKI